MSTLLTVNLATQTSTTTTLSPEELEAIGQDHEPHVPLAVSSRQMRLWLNNHWTTDDVNMYTIAVQAINEITDEQERRNAQIEFEHATVIRREHPLVELVRIKLGMTQEEMDQAFRDATIDYGPN